MQKLPKYFALNKRSFNFSFLFFFLCIAGFSQNKITGVVTGSDNLPLEGAIVTNKTLNKTIFTSADGSYAITAKKGDIIAFSFIGYKSRQIETGNDVIINVSLEISVINLDDLVVTGYTTQR